MAKVNAPLLAFSAGEVSRDAQARVDVERLRLATECQVNWLPTVIGAQSLRPGTQYLGSTKSDADAFLIEFIFGATDTAILECTANIMRVWKSDALITRPSVATVVTNGDFSSSAGWTLTASSGATASISGGMLQLTANPHGATAFCERQVTVAGGDVSKVHGLRILVGDGGTVGGPVNFQIGSTSGGIEYLDVTELKPGTHSIAFTPTGNFYVRFSTATMTDKFVDSITVESSGDLELPTPWGANDLDFIRYAQSGDIVFVACDGIAQYQIERRDNDSWSVVKYRADKGPFIGKPAPAEGVTLVASAQYGNVSLTASRDFFTTSMLGGLIRLPNGGQDMVRQIGAGAQFTEAVRVRGIGTVNDYSYTLSGTWVGTLSRQISYDGASFGFARAAQHTVNGTTNVAPGTDHDNITFWVKLGFEDPSKYTSGNVTATFDCDVTDGSAGIARITGYASRTSVTVEMLKPMKDEDVLVDWEIGKWSTENGFPSAVAIYQGRLWWAGADSVNGSVSDDYTNFDDTVEGDSAPISRTVGSAEIANINWLLPLRRLIVGCDGSEVAIRSSSFDEPLTPINAMPDAFSTQGSTTLPAVKIDSTGYMVEKSGRRVYEVGWSSEAQDYHAIDMTRLNLDIGKPGFVGTAGQRQPDTRLHFVRADGEAAILLRSTADEIACWTREMTLGVIERRAVLPGNLEDSVYSVVKRTINGATKRFVEKSARRDQCEGGTLNYQADSFKVISQASSTTITGLSHLEGESVIVWANGKDLGSYTVSGGQITGVSEAVTSAIVGLGGLTFSSDTGSAVSFVSVGSKYDGYPAEVFATRSTGGHMHYRGSVTIASGKATLPEGKSAMKIIVYMGYYGIFRSAKLAYGAQMGTALTQRKKIDGLGLIAQDLHPQGLKVGQTFELLDDMPLYEEEGAVTQDEIWDDYDADITSVPGEWDTDARLCLLAQAPRPVTLSAVVVAVRTNER